MEKNNYLPPIVQILSFAANDIVTASVAEGWLGSDGNVDSEGWT